MTNGAAPLRKEIEELAVSQIAQVFYAGRDHPRLLPFWFGEGDTPIKDVLRLIRDNKWNIQATIEFEYKVPADSDRMKEIARAIKFCRDALAS